MTAPDGPLVTTAWLQAHLDDPDVVVLEVDEQPLIYNVGHIPGAHNVDWRADLQAHRTRDIPDADAIRELWQRLGITTDSTVVLYGDWNNWYACFAYSARRRDCTPLRARRGARYSKPPPTPSCSTCAPTPSSP